MRKQSTLGFIFLAVLIFLNLFSCMGLYALSRSVIAVKLNQHDWQRDKDSALAQAILRDLENKILTSKNLCSVEPISSTLLPRKPKAWWQQYACRDTRNNIEYYYFVESLGKDACASVAIVADKQFYMPEYFRITLLVLSAKMKYARIILQSTIAKLTNEISTCSSEIHVVKPGRQMWREI